MREIKFRGKSIVTGEWLYGSLINNAFFRSNDRAPVPYILDTDKMVYDNFSDIGEQLDYFEVIPESVGQYTGISDKCNQEVCGGDVIELKERTVNGFINTHICKVFQSDTGAWRLEGRPTHDKSYGTKRMLYDVRNRIEIIGNIYENPELLERIA
ncbi:YopX family protein [Oceanobacillus sp. FSL W8-0428]|uniref:YopX family protein n=1 Tax=Oceanobacillus sp. FSL W8-0428 TaxID=2921715 RepID=UPI0030FB0CA8